MSGEPARETQGTLARFRALAGGHGSDLAVKTYTVAFTLVITAVFGLAVSGLNGALKETKAQKSLVARQQVLLRVLGVLGEDESLSATETSRRYEEEIEPVETSHPESGAYTYYRLRKTPSTVAFPIQGRGFWGPIRGFLAVETGGGEITGIAFNKQEETPGLGARITELDFRRQFEGLRYNLPPENGRRLRVVTGPVTDRNREVEGITGATGTSQAVEELLNASIDRFLAVRDAGESKGETP
jgi:Na+-transporting NADH:ubiquinone oxidoreductase subunit C